MEIILIWIVFIILYAIIQGLSRTSGQRRVLDQPAEVPEVEPEERSSERLPRRSRPKEEAPESPPEPEPARDDEIGSDLGPSPIEMEGVVTTRPRSRSSREIGRLLRSPGGLRNAVIVSEVLGPPKGLE